MREPVPLRSDATNLYKARWPVLEGRPAPVHLREVVEIPYVDFRDRVFAHDVAVADDLYAGTIFVLKGAFPKAFCESLIRNAFDWGNASEPSFHKMVDGCPDFHRRIDSTTTQAYASTAVRHGYYFFRWNDDPMGVFAQIEECWRVLKVLAGGRGDEFKRNIPRDGVVDRLILYHYPLGAGELKMHADPTNNQKIVMGGFLSSRGVDFERGGIFFVKADGRKVDVEAQVSAGDLMITYPTVLHGVDVIDPGTDVVWDTRKGRWFIGFSSVDSDYVANRSTTIRKE